jgi:exodeoxyribonuclease V gamma subunit
MPFLSSPLHEPGPEFRRLTLDDLARFLANPCAFLLRRRLGVRLRQAGEALEEREPFHLDAREGYFLKQQLLEARLAGIEPARALEVIAATGALPLGQVGRVQSRSIAAAVDSVWQRLERFGPPRPGTVLDVDLSLGSFHLTGRVTPREAGGMVHARVAVIKARDILGLWIQHLAAGAAGRHGESILIGSNATHAYRPCDDAAGTLERLLELYWRGLRQPLKFFPRSSRAFAEAERTLAASLGSGANPFAPALKEWEGGKFNDMPGEREDLSFQLCFGDATPLDDEFATLARQVFGPVLGHETVEEA